MDEKYRILYGIKRNGKVINEIAIDRSTVSCKDVVGCLMDHGYTIYYKTKDGKRHKLFWEANPQRYLH